MSELLNAKELKERASLVDLLRRLGYKCVRKSGREHLYISMLRADDTNPSLSVNDELGVWFDHGTSKGGNIIDFGLAYWKQLSFKEVVEKIQQVCSLTGNGSKPGRSRKPGKPVKVPHFVIEEIKELGTHPAITEYLKGRKVFDAGKFHLKEIYYYVKDPQGGRKHYFSAGWKNEEGGWEVRNKYFKGCLGLKAISFVPGHAKEVVVFEGCINYLSWKADNPEAMHSVIILNSLTLILLGIAKAKEFSYIDLYLDRDYPGHLGTQEFIKALPYATDRSYKYDGFNDYNDKLVATPEIKLMPDPFDERRFKRSIRF